jgi:hypothetical protein
MTRTQLLLKRLRQQRAKLKSGEATIWNLHRRLTEYEQKIDELNRTNGQLKRLFRIEAAAIPEDDQLIKCVVGVTRTAWRFVIHREALIKEVATQLVNKLERFR